MYTGHLTLEFEHTTKTLEKKSDRLYENALLPEAAGEEKWLATMQQQAKQRLEQPVFQVTKPYNKEWFHRSQLSNLFAECLYDYTKADCVLFNAGIFVESMNKGLSFKI